ncbi:MAG: 50S ribosomal protein L16 [Candidatus Moranbacteria bacterium]|nr:50S ribosomal protein L16 [Candidatus Moranbacteria bacterium]
MLLPKKVKHRKQHRRKFRKLTKRGDIIKFGSFGLKVLDSTWISSRQLEAARRAMTRFVQRQGKVWIRVFPDSPVTQKGAETPMGKGKGSVEYFVASVNPGRIIFELDGVSEEIAKTALKRAGDKLSARTKIVQR